MAKRGGFPGMGMPGNMNNLMKQAQRNGDKIGEAIARQKMMDSL